MADAAQACALRRDGKSLKWLDRAWARRTPGIVYLLCDPFVLRCKDDSRLAAFAKEVGLSMTTEAKAVP